MQDKDAALEQAVETLAEAKADKIISVDPATGAVTVENLIGVKQALLQETADMNTALTETKDELLGEIESPDEAKEDKTPQDGKLYGLKDGGKVELLPGCFGVVNAVDRRQPNAAGNVRLDAAHLIHDPTTQNIYEAAPGDVVGVIVFDTAAAPAPLASAEEVIFEDEEGNLFYLRNREDGCLVITAPDTQLEGFLPRQGF
jgi:hypothetical protein